jgi:prepilin-type N-terminal cleavage/methylation domain-containing protein
MPALSRPIARRWGFTLVELLVVMGILLVLATLVVVFVLPAFQDNKNVVRGVDKVTTALLITKQRALRDVSPRGVRFLLDPTALASGQLQVTQIQYIEQPESFRGGTVSGADNTKVVTVTGTATDPADMLGGADPANRDQYLVQDGDYFRYEKGPTFILRIQTVTPTPTGGTLLFNTQLPAGGAPSSAQYHIIRQPRPISGEPVIDLPRNVIVDLSVVAASGPNYQMPSRPNANPALPAYYEILFDPAGGVTNRYTSTPIVLVVRDATAANPLDANTTRVLGINPRTGFISAHPVAPAPNPLAYALDGKSSGL